MSVWIIHQFKDCSLGKLREIIKKSDVLLTTTKLITNNIEVKGMAVYFQIYASANFWLQTVASKLIYFKKKFRKIF